MYRCRMYHDTARADNVPWTELLAATTAEGGGVKGEEEEGGEHDRPPREHDGRRTDSVIRLMLPLATGRRLHRPHGPPRQAGGGDVCAWREELHARRGRRERGRAKGRSGAYVAALFSPHSSLANNYRNHVLISFRSRVITS
ncbi:hypothetical protein E2C01_077796 [Portunus trituberculatus]|uniref:Uncharacterized protein n=1 Tax=Portunus trituberculatus TaxID=210409 RepID=A0A5B7IL79_PORTR|nr:hypothetical protein [Portunus trituberculatus]